MAETGRAWLKTTGEQVTSLFCPSPRSHTSIDDGGWLGLSGEPLADLNMTCVFSGPTASVRLNEYVDTANGAEVPVIVMLEEPAEELITEAAALGAAHVGNIPVMVWQNGVLPERAKVDQTRIAMNDEERTAAIEVMAKAFSLDLAICTIVMLQILEGHNVTCWIYEHDNHVVVGAGIGIRSDDIVGVYNMATQEHLQRKGIGKNILSSMMSNCFDEGVASFYLGASPAGLHLYEQLGYETIANPAAAAVGASTQFH